MISLEIFKKAIQTIQDFDKKMGQVSDIMIVDCVGFIDFHHPIISTLVKTLEQHFDNPQAEWISWWLYENSKWVAINNKEYSIDTIEDLYFWLCGDYDKVHRYIGESKLTDNTD